MPHHKLTDAFVKTVKPPAGGQVDYFDPSLPGFSLRVTARGVKTWTLFYRVDGKQVRQSLGRFPAVTLGAARQKAGTVQELLDTGKDPRLEAERERREATDARANTVEALTAEFVEKHAKANGNATWPETQRILSVYVNPALGQLPVSAITPRDVIDLLDAVADRKAKHPDTGAAVGGPIMANRVHSALHKMFRWAKRKHKIAINPAADLDKRREHKGTRTLTDAEIHDVWTAADTLGYPAGHFVKALLLTGRREAKVATMQRPHLDRVSRVWAPPDTSANKQSPELPLFTALEALLDAIPEAGKNGDCVFKQRRKQRHGDKMVTVFRDKPVNSFNAIKRSIDAAIAAARSAAGAPAMPEWDLSRDVRRTVKTRLAELGVEKDLRDLILGHARTGMDAVYDHSKRREEKRAALERWGQHLAGIVGPSSQSSNVVGLRPTKAAGNG